MNLLVFTLFCFSQAPDESADRAEARLQFMIQKVDEFKLALHNEPTRMLNRVSQPLLHYTNPVRAILTKHYVSFHPRVSR